MKIIIRHRNLLQGLMTVFLITTISLGMSCKAPKTTLQETPEEQALKSAEQGNPEAQNQLGYDMIHGEGIPQNIEEGVGWIQKAADQGYSKAQYNLAIMYQSGKWVEPDLSRAFELMSKASQQGLIEAQTSLGFMYERGIGTKLDMHEALYWYQQAATFGKAASKSKKYYKENLLPHREEQFLYGDRDAQFMLGRIYEEGIEGIGENLDLAAKWYEDAAVRGDVASQARLAMMLGVQGKPKLDTIWGFAWAKVAASSDLSGNHSMPLRKLEPHLSEEQKSQAESTYDQLNQLVAYNLKDLNLSMP
jgi:TPR repeat protein